MTVATGDLSTHIRSHEEIDDRPKPSKYNFSWMIVMPVTLIACVVVNIILSSSMV